MVKTQAVMFSESVPLFREFSYLIKRQILIKKRGFNIALHKTKIITCIHVKIISIKYLILETVKNSKTRDVRIRVRHSKQRYYIIRNTCPLTLLDLFTTQYTTDLLIYCNHLIKIIKSYIVLIS